MAKKPNPPDSTARNIRASQRRDDTLAEKLATLEARVRVLEAEVIASLTRLEGKVDAYAIDLGNTEAWAAIEERLTALETRPDGAGMDHVRRGEDG